MDWREKLALAMVLLAVAAVYTGAAWLVGAELWARGRGEAVPPARVVARWLFVVLAAAGILLGIYGYFIEPRRLEVTRVRIGCDKLPAGSAPVRIAHLSDVHSEPTPRLEKRLAHEVERFKPDVVCFTGDAANVWAAVPVFRQMLGDLAKIAPTYGVAGNWELTNGWTEEVFDGTGAVRLTGQAARLTTRAGQPLVLAGADAGDHLQFNAALEALDGRDATIFLYHYPAGVTQLPAGKVDLLLAGHVHGGQVAIPGYGAVITLSATSKQYERGLYRVGNTHLYVSRGIGTEGGRGMGIRLFSRPELVLIELVPVGPTAAGQTAQAADWLATGHGTDG